MNKYWRKFVPEAKKIQDSEGSDALVDTRLENIVFLESQ
jgi:hypothetical protein